MSDYREYNKFEYLYPPRPDKSITPELLGFYNKRGYYATLKANGTNNIIAVGPDRILKCMTRHKEDHKLWVPTENSSKIFQNLPGKGWYVFTAELMHSKVKNGPKDTNYIHDILVNDGKYLLGSTYIERQNMLKDIFIKGNEEQDSKGRFIILNNNTWLAINHTSDFKRLFEQFDNEYDEGLVLKNPNAKLELCSRETSNSNWQVKCRKATKNYGF